MPFIETVANDLAKCYVQAKNKRYAINRMIFEINYLTDPATKQPLDFDIKAAILKEIDRYISGEKKMQVDACEEINPVFDNINVFFERKKNIVKELKISAKQRAMLN